MFGFLKDKLKKSVTKLAEKIKEAPAEKPKKKEEKPAEKPEKKPAAKPEKKPVKRAKPEKPAKPTKPAKPAKPAKAVKPAKPAKPEKVEPEPEQQPEPEVEKAVEEEVKEEVIEVVEEVAEKVAEEKEITEEEVKEVVEEVVEEKDVAEKEEEVKEVVEEVAEEVVEEKKPEKKPGFFDRLRGVKKIKKITTIKEVVIEKTLTEKDIDSFFTDSETDLLQANIALEAIDYMKDSMKKGLAEKKIKRRGAEQFISNALEETLLGLVDHGTVSLEKVIKDAKKQGKPACLVFLGFNGAGKTTSIAKVARYLMDKGHSVVLAAGDTFRAASIEQLEHHGNKLGIKTIKHNYGSDSAAVVFDACKHAEAKGIDVVLADTAGRMHTDKNLADELKKVIRVNQPDLKVLLVDSLTGNDAVEQAKQFHAMVGVDTVIMAKTDVNEKGGSILSVSYAIKKPILFLGTGQEYKDLEKFRPKQFVKGLLE